ncbi:hypothetical protein INR49_017996 [Caranx melampygus]|nr:hypothetical protein INR49_017996 [Caranx melampygus]
MLVNYQAEPSCAAQRTVTQTTDQNLHPLLTLQLHSRFIIDSHTRVILDIKHQKRRVPVLKGHFCFLSGNVFLKCELMELIEMKFKDPEYADGFVFKALLLPGAKIPNKVLKPDDWVKSREPWRPQLGFNPNRQQAHLDQSGFRALGHSLNRNQHGGGQYSNTPPPSSYQQGNYRPPHSRGHQPFQHSRQNSLLGAPPSFHQPQYPRQQQQYGGGGGGGGGGRGGHGWDRAMQSQQSAYQQNMNRGGGGGPHGGGGGGSGGYQQRYDHRRDDWHDRRDNRGQQHQVTAPELCVIPPNPKLSQLVGGA